MNIFGLIFGFLEHQSDLIVAVSIQLYVHTTIALIESNHRYMQLFGVRPKCLILKISNVTACFAPMKKPGNTTNT